MATSSKLHPFFRYYCRYVYFFAEVFVFDPWININIREQRKSEKVILKSDGSCRFQDFFSSKKMCTLITSGFEIVLFSC